MALTSADHEEIKGLLARYGHCIDFEDVEGLEACFAADGAFVGPLEQYSGSAELREFGHSVARRNEGHVRHIVLTSLIDGDGNAAHALSLALFTRDFGAAAGRSQLTPAAVLSSGYYDDRLVRVDGAWRFARREFTFDGTSAAQERVRKPLTVSAIDASAPETTDAYGMTALDYEAIRQLLYRYSYTIDFQDFDGLVGCFTADGTFEVPERLGVPEHVVRGSADLREFAKAVGAAGEGQSRHASVGIVIDGDGERATVSSYCLNPMTYLYGFVPLGNEFAERHNPMFGKTGLYRDEVVKVDGYWKIRRRTFGFDAQPAVTDLLGRPVTTELLA